jgi:hypothetical protein
LNSGPHKSIGILIVCIILASTFNLRSALCTNIASGDWTNGTNWSCGHAPACGDSIVIKAGTTVTISSQQDYSACGTGPVIVVRGELHFITGDKLRLPCNSRIYIFPGGTITQGGGGGNSNTIEICSDILWNAADGTLSGPSCLPPTLPGCGVVLPVELAYFKGEAKDGYVSLDWMTASERKSSYFDIERSTDASTFDKVISIRSKAIYGNSTVPLTYNTVDNSPIENISYYRLKQVDLDNTFEYSSVISVNYNKTKNLKFTVYPNPNKGEFIADISGLENNHEVQITLKDIKGNVVYTSAFYIQDQASSKLNIVPMNKLSNGLYICTLTLEGIDYNVKVVVN